MNDQTTFSDNLRQYLSILWQWSWLLVLIVLVAGVSAYYISTLLTPVYRASTLVMVNGATGSQYVNYDSMVTSQYLAETYAEVMTTRPVFEGVIRRLGLSGTTVKSLQDAVTVQPVRDTQLIRVNVEDKDPKLAALIANALVTEFADQNQADQASRFAASKQNLEAQLAELDGQIQATTNGLNELGQGSQDQAERTRLEETLTQYRQSYTSLLQSYEELRLTEARTTSTILQKEPAVPPPRPVRPILFLNTLLAVVASLLLAVGVIFLVEAMDDTLRDPDDVPKQLGLPLLGMIIHHPESGKKPICAGQPRSPTAESFRSLRTNLQFSSLDKPLRSLVVTSPSPEDGKSTVASNLAVVFAQSGRRVVLLDADLRRPKVHRMLGLSNRAGLSDFFLRSSDSSRSSLDLDACLQSSEVQNLSALTTGSLPPNPSELLGSEKMLAILQQVGEQADILVLDTPPILPVTDAAVLATRVDGVLLVLKPGVTRLGACKQALEQLERVGANVLGVVLNDVGARRSRYAYYHYKGSYNVSGYPYAEVSLIGSKNGKQPKAQEKIDLDMPR